MVGALGFSAGGHLTATLAVHWDHYLCEVDDLTVNISARPDAVVLCYPVIDMDQHRHRGSFNNLMGPVADEKLVDALSCQKQVRSDSPPAFLWHTADDGAVPVQNSLLYFSACREKQVRAELHVYESGHHGMGLADKHETIRSWTTLACEFLKRHLS
ncbi:MAG: alpha/beta hydrolase [Phycisphaerales bacterium]|nr:alpha/beta hydrolase [Phycisphaerales bacterium]